MKSKINELLRYEEGVRYTPYLDSLGNPTIGMGFKIGTQGAPIKYFDFRIGDATIDAWLSDNLSYLAMEMADNAEINEAMQHCNQQRQDILTSMAYQMGVSGLSNFHHMLSAIIDEDWDEAAAQMLDSLWAEETPARANREAAVMRSGRWRPTYDF